MSIEVMTRVWKFSLHEGSKLLLLLAIADMANDAGVAWPSVLTLAQKIRMSERQTRALLGKLLQSGELEIERRAYDTQTAGGLQKTNIYRIRVEGGAKIAPPPENKVVQFEVQGGAISRKGGAIATAPESSLKHSLVKQTSIKAFRSRPTKGQLLAEEAERQMGVVWREVAGREKRGAGGLRRILS